MRNVLRDSVCAYNTILRGSKSWQAGPAGLFDRFIKVSHDLRRVVHDHHALPLFSFRRRPVVHHVRRDSLQL